MYEEGHIRVFSWSKFQVDGIKRIGCFGSGFTVLHALRSIPEPFEEGLITIEGDRLVPHLYAFIVEEDLIRVQISLVRPMRQVELSFYEAGFEAVFSTMSNS